NKSIFDFGSPYEFRAALLPTAAEHIVCASILFPSALSCVKPSPEMEYRRDGRNEVAKWWKFSISASRYHGINCTATGGRWHGDWLK
ncbi:MAG: hypothetical protein V3T62_02955, partial [Alphaproteobacteria bacterium]